MALNDMEQVLEENIDQQSASYVFKNAYEVIRTAINSRMAENGYRPYSHTATIAFARDRMNITKAEATRINRYRKLRNSIQYRAERVTVEEAREIVESMEKTVKEIFDK